MSRLASVRTADRRGLTLIELLVASVLLGTVLTVLVQGVAMATRISSQAHRETRAVQLVESLVAQLRIGALPVDESNEGDFEEQGLARYRWVVTSEAEGEDEGLFRVTIAVYWPAGVDEDKLEVVGFFYKPEEPEEG